MSKKKPELPVTAKPAKKNWLVEATATVVVSTYVEATSQKEAEQLARDIVARDEWYVRKNQIPFNILVTPGKAT